MIDLPRRPVTRFFVPLIDVLILLFCIFLLMPFVSRPETEKASNDTEGILPTDVIELQDRVRLAEKLAADLMREREMVADRLSVRVLEIDPAQGRLFYLNTDGPEPERLEVANEAAARLLIDRAKQTAAAGKKIYFHILYPRQLSGFPTKNQRDQYDRWFKDIPHGFDNPLHSGT